MYIWLFVIYSYINDDNAGVLQNTLEKVTSHKTSESRQMDYTDKSRFGEPNMFPLCC
jgi:hypothetical protein